MIKETIYLIRNTPCVECNTQTFGIFHSFCSILEIITQQNRVSEMETTTTELTLDEESLEPTTVPESLEANEHLESAGNHLLEPMAQTSVKFDTQIEHTVHAVVSWYSQIQVDCQTPSQIYHNYTVTYHTLEQPEESKTKVSTAPFILLNDLIPNQDYMYEVTSRDIKGSVLWSAKQHLNTG